MLLLLSWLAAAAFPSCVCAQPAPAPAPPSNRYLFVVETSHSMQRRSEAVLKTVQDLLLSGMKGQLHPGDTLGLWTFNDDLYAGRFPLHDYSPENQRALASAVREFLSQQTCEKSAKLDKVWPALSRLIQDSDFLTIVFVTSGDATLEGTPFDAPIKQFYRTWYAEQQKAKMPFVTVLRSKQGKLTDYSIGAAPWPIEMPPLPPELRATNIVPTIAASPAKLTPATAAPLIVVGKKPEPPAPVASTIAPPPATPPSSPVSNSASPALPQVPTPSVASNSPPAQPLLALSGKSDSNTSAVVPLPARQPATLSPAPTQPLPASVENAVVAPSAARKGGNLFLFAGLAGLVIVTVAIFLRRRSRLSSRGSLITRSFDRENRPPT